MTRVLHIVGGMNRGGVETWLMHVLRNIDRDRYHFDFLVSKTKPCAYDDEIRSLDSKIISCPNPQKPMQYAKRFIGVVKENGPYDIIHSHVHHFSGFNLFLAGVAGVKTRIAHSHNDTSVAERERGASRKLYLTFMEYLIRRFATHGFACSNVAGQDLYGRNWLHASRWTSLYYSIDLEPFKAKYTPTALRKELGIPADALVVGHVGRFSNQKNHIFLLDVFAALLKQEPKAFLLLVGDGDLREQIETKAKTLGIYHNIIFAGVRADIPALMKGAMDVFCFPSLHEGLPVTIIEAQAAGLPCLLSNQITTEVCVLDRRIRQLPLADTTEDWATAIIDMHQSSPKKDLTNSEFKKLLPFDIHESVTQLCSVYEQQIANAKKSVISLISAPLS